MAKEVYKSDRVWPLANILVLSLFTIGYGIVIGDVVIVGMFVIPLILVGPGAINNTLSEWKEQAGGGSSL